MAEETAAEKFALDFIEFTNDAAAVSLLVIGGPEIAGLEVIALGLEVLGVLPSFVMAAVQKEPKSSFIGLGAGLVLSLALGEPLANALASSDTAGFVKIIARALAGTSLVVSSESIANKIGALFSDANSSNPININLPDTFTLDPNTLPPGQNYITTSVDDGQETAVQWNYPLSMPGVNSGELDLLLNQDQVPVTLYKGITVELR